MIRLWAWIRTWLQPELTTILAKLDTVLKGQQKMSKEIDDLTAAVAKQTTVVASAVTLIQGLAKQIADAKDDPAAIEALASQLNSTADDLAAAVQANTPAA